MIRTQLIPKIEEKQKILMTDKENKEFFSSVYVKTLDSLWNSVDDRIANGENKYLEWVSRLSIASQNIFDNNAAAVQKIKTLHKSLTSQRMFECV